ncbi:glucosaminidase domain-containing protein [Cohnella lubricantis]|uniref:Glucosaminidase domain-containing protein n=1 Tax=Cohnella lubricantis TaxID=2163172 RepID=A0A841T7V4_9BACL|nr:glucosaminidase domain-containing protein [Cohnella lubricantis]MBB6676169.1 glucosaminidase domain-containing protein [Cohnella lubricantis]MBP2118638.1 hypothetical protein [Cohnella lubricantis]
MENAVLLTPTDVNVIRRYVHTKYAPLPGSRKAEIVAEAVRSALERRLPELPAAVKTRMTNELIRRCLVTEQREVIAEDVLTVYESEQWPEEIDSEPLARWIEEKTLGRWTRQQVESRIRRSRRTEVSVAESAEQREAAEVASISAAVDGATEILATELVQSNAGSEPMASASTSALTLTLTSVFASPTGDTIAIDADAISEPARPPSGWRRHAAWLALVLSLGAGAAIGLATDDRAPSADLDSGTAIQEVVTGEEEQKPDIGMPKELRYTDIDEEAVKAYMRSRDSILVDEPYFSAIVDSAHKYDINPLLMFAITGQEQGFVPRSGKNAKQIANNPFNVFHSWQEYNTDIADSSAVAAKLIAKLGASRPEGEEPFTWLNRIYAEDPAWSDGVRQLFDKLANLPSGQ